jgi:Protein of unknown function (DUF3300)
MTLRTSGFRFLSQLLRGGVATLCVALLAIGDPVLLAQPTPRQEEQAQKISNDQLDSLVAPIALYPDPLLAQVLAASTYPLELVQLQQWLGKHKDLKDQALADAVQKEDWDPSVQSMAAFPDVVKNLVDNIKWTTDLGNAFLAQQSDVMEAVQRMRKKAQDKGTLKSNEQVKVETKTVESQQVIVVEQSNPQVVYVPSGDPTVVYGAPPPAYPYPTGYYVAGMALSFGVGMAMGAMWSGGWGYGCGWGGNNNITINNNNNFNRNSNIQGGNRTNIGGGNRGQGSWQHNPQHRGGTPYSNRSTADRFGGTTRGSSQAARQNSARQNVGRQQAAGREFGSSNRGGGARPSQGQLGAGAGGGRGGAGGADRIGNRSVSQGGASRGSGAGGLGGSGRSASGGGARASSSRGASSMGSKGGGSRGGGGGRRR